MPGADRAASAFAAATGDGGGIGPEELYPPAQYSGWWLLLALGIIVVLVVATLVILRVTRAPREKAAQPSAPQGTPVQQLERLRADYLRRIDGVEHAYRDGRLDPRGVNAELSSLTRSFVNDYTGVATPVMSLEELGQQNVHPALVQALNAFYYPSIFGDRPPADPTPGIAAAREVVMAWH